MTTDGMAENGTRDPSEHEVAEFEHVDAPVRDAIGEEDNAIPLWFNVSFYAMIVAGFFYLFYYTLSGWSQAVQYDAEVAAFDERYAEFATVAASTNPLHGDAAAIESGETTFATICAACHKPDGSGLIGPSLVDPYWKYGSDDSAQFVSVTEGRPGGMPPWGAQLSDDEAWSVIAYVNSLPRSSEPGVGAPSPEAAPEAAPASP